MKNTTKLVYIILSTLVSSCAAPLHVTPELQPYVKRFSDIYGVGVYNAEIKFKDLKQGLDAICVHSYPSKIYIDIKWYARNKNNYYAVEQLMFHEIGHCEFNLRHDSCLTANNKPCDIMYPVTFGYSEHYKEKRPELLQRFGDKIGRSVRIN